MYYKRRIIAAFTATVTCASALLMSGCGKQDDNIVSEDSLWYSTTKATIGQQYSENDDIQTFSPTYLGRIDDKLIFLTTCSYYRDAVSEYDVAAPFEQYLYGLDVYGLDGTLISSFDITQNLKDCDPHAGEEAECYMLSVQGGIRDDQALVAINDAEFIVDEDTGEVVSAQLATGDGSGAVEDGIFEFAGYEVKLYFTFENEFSDTQFQITDPDGEVSEFCLSDKITMEDGTYVDGVIYMGDDKAVVKLSDYNWNESFYELDLKTFQMTEYSGETGWFRDDFYDAVYFEGVGNVIVNQTGIRKLDFEANEKTEVFSFDSCNINRYDADNLLLLEMDEDTIIMTSRKYNGNSYYSDLSGESDLYILIRQDSNPNAGKTILTAASLDTFDYAFCEAVCRYNESDPDHFIRLENKYSTEARYMNGELDSYSEDKSEEYLESMGELSTLLMVDLLSGDGPDLIINGGSYAQLNSDDYLLDLSDSIDTDGLFTNVIDASKQDGKIYQLPLALTVLGIVTKKEDVAPDQAGFTFEQYEDFVSTVCNGTDPVGIGKIDFFINAMTSVCHECVVNDNADFDNAGFRALAEYVSENVLDMPEGSDEENIVFVEPVPSSQVSAEYYPNLSFDYLMFVYSDSISDIKVMGLPSPDGRGPGISISSSVAISAKTDQIDACKAFVNMLLSEEIQYAFGRFDGTTPMRKSSFEQAARESIDQYNDLYERYSRLYTSAEIRMLGFPWCEVDYASIDEYESMIESCSYIDSVDPAIAVIIREEMPAYFSGQKTLDEVLILINDRTQTFLDERG